MIAFLRRLNIINWPMWLKFSVGLGAAFLLPFLVGLVLVIVSTNDVRLQNLRNYVSEIGPQHTAAVNAAMDRARGIQREFLVTSEYYDSLIVYLLAYASNDTGNLPASSRQQANVLLRRGLLGGNSPYLSARVLSPSGALLASAVLDQTPPDTLEPDQSGTLAFVNAQSTVFSVDLQSVTIRRALGYSVVEITQPIYADTVLVGYLIVLLDMEKLFDEAIPFESTAYPAYTFLAARDGFLQTFAEGAIIRGLDPDVFAQSVSADSRATRSALGGLTGVDTYSVLINGVPTDVMGYFAPIADTPIAIVVEVPHSSALAIAREYFAPRLFVVVIGALLFVGVLVLLFNQILVPPLRRLRHVIEGMGVGSFDEPLTAGKRSDEIGELVDSVVETRQQVQTLIKTLEERIVSRTRDISTTQEISQFVAAQRDPQRLMNQAVQLIVERFPNIYHAQVFLIDEDRRSARLVSSTGEPGRKLLERGHHLVVGGVSVIGQVTELGEVVVARDTSTSSVHRRNELLPDTRSELAIPLRVGDQIIGALDVQSKQSDSFSADEIAVLRIMSDQIAVAIENARLYEQSLRRLAEIDRANRSATLKTWREYMRDQRAQRITSTAGIEPKEDLSDLRKQALATGTVAVGSSTGRNTINVAIPLQLRGQTLGVVEWELPIDDFDNNKIALAQELANRLAVSLENARLFQDSQRATERERLVNEISTKLTAQTDINEILQTAVREVGQALRTPQASIRLTHSSANVNGNGNGNGASSGPYGQTDMLERGD